MIHLPSYIDLDQDYFIERAKKIDEYLRLSGLHKQYFEALKLWSDYQKFYSQTVSLGMFVPCSVKLEKPSPFDYTNADQTKHAEDTGILTMERSHDYEIDLEAYEQSGKPLVKPENYEKWNFNHSVTRDTEQWWQLCLEYHEAEQRTLFTGWKSDKEGCLIRISDGLTFHLSVYDDNISLARFVGEFREHLPLNESNPDIIKLFLSETETHYLT